MAGMGGRIQKLTTGDVEKGSFPARAPKIERDEFFHTMNSSEKIRIVIVGFGFMGEMHAQAYAKIPMAEIVAVVDARPEAALEKLDRLELGVPVFTSLTSALAEQPADIVDICLPTDQHVAAAVEALEAGKHVFCEKPLALSLHEAKLISEAQERSGTYFQVGHCLRFWPEYQAFSSFVKGGTAGRLLSLTMQRRSARPAYSAGDWLNDANRSMGAAVDLHIHDTDYLVSLLGTPRTVYSRATVDKTGYSHIFTDYGYPDVVVQAEGGWNYPSQWGFQMAFQAVFENGSIEFDSNQNPSLSVTLDGKATEPLPFVEAGGGNALGTSGNVSALGGYINELIYFLNAVSTKNSPEIATLSQATESLRVVLAEVESATVGKMVEL